MSKRRKFTGVQWIETMRDGDKTFAFGVYADVKIGRVPFIGMADRNVEEDRENSTRGRNLAIGRAFEKLGKEIEKREWQKMKSNGTATVAKKLSEAEKKKLMNTPEAKAIREKRAKKKVNKKTTK
jgi:hypothetical protein